MEATRKFQNSVILNITSETNAHGLVMRTKEHKEKSDLCQTTAITLLPTPFPRKLFEQAVKVQNVS
ncbi:unnamed protein product [Strongylus vulgaris]|uniref:Uncharacterized protein n=1 Tax=Strongylus vulgaris TaxID=40348 RepID=A0A3P7JL62_STRVU|nr:unnamed protein product [Strongylus vulgaris]